MQVFFLGFSTEFVSFHGTASAGEGIPSCVISDTDKTNTVNCAISNTGESLWDTGAITNPHNKNDNQQQRRQAKQQQTKDESTSWPQDEGPKTAKI